MKNIVLGVTIIMYLSSCRGGDSEGDPSVDASVIFNADELLVTHFKQGTAGNPSSFESSVKRFNLTNGSYIDDFVRNQAGGLINPQDLAFGPDGELYVSGLGNPSILRYDGETGEFIDEFTSGFELSGPTKFKFRADFLYVAQWGASASELNNVARFDAQTGEFINEFTDQPFPRGMGIAFDEDNNLYAISFSQRRVFKYASDGMFQEAFISSQLSGPVNLWVQNGQFFVQDWENGSIKQFDNEGDFVEPFITGLSNTEGFVQSSNGYLVADWSTADVNLYESEGSFTIRLIEGGTGGLNRPTAMLLK